MLLLDIITRENATECFSCWDYTFSGQLPYFIHMIYILLKIGVPIVLVIFGMIDFAKATIAKDQDGMKVAQQAFIRRLIAAAIVFLVLQLVQIITGLLMSGGSEEENLNSCIQCFINGDCTNVGGVYPECGTLPSN